MAGVRLVDDHLANPRLEMEGVQEPPIGGGGGCCCFGSSGHGSACLPDFRSFATRMLASIFLEAEWFTSSSGEFLLSSGRSEEYGGLSRRPSTFTRFGCCWTER
uniref:Uncharacterized protein n=1 Tax=Oryza meridionalis TaxID=40149 RepID=A0A0E0CCM5_9ORYZ